MSATTAADLAADFAWRCDGAKQTGEDWWMRCPAHDDHTPSLKITPKTDRILIKCFAKCESKAILDALGLGWDALFVQPRPRDPWAKIGKVTGRYDYVDAHGTVVHQTVRFQPDSGTKKFRQHRPDPTVTKAWQPGWKRQVTDIQQVLYHLPAVGKAIAAGELVYLVEGEKDADSLEAIGLTATCNPEGAKGWKPHYDASLRGAHLVCLPDFDQGGQQLMGNVATRLQGVAASVKLLTDIHTEKSKSDVSDWLAEGHTRAELETAVAACPVWTPHSVPAEDSGTPAPQDPDEALLDELAQLSPLAYDRCRKDKADALNIRLSTLDAEIAARRATLAAPPAAEGEDIAQPEPWEEAVDGATLLNDLTTLFQKHAILPPGGAEALALWTVFTYVFHEADVNPRLQLTSPLMRCGKTRVLDTLSLLVSRPLPASNVSPSAIFRVIQQCAPSLLIDEADAWAKDNEDLRGLLNSGHTRRAAFVLRSVPVGDNQWEARQFSTWAPIALSGIGRLFPTLEDRSIRIVLKRKLKTEKVSKLPKRDDVEPFVSLRRQCARWGDDHLEALRDLDPEPPAGLNDRAADNWSPLLAIAEVAGGEWPERIKVVIEALNPADGDNEGLGVLLLKDMQQAFREQMAKDPKANTISSEALSGHLHGLEERPWSEYGRGEDRKPISKEQIARLLRPFEIRPRNIRDGAVLKGYRLDACQDAFARYLSSATPPSQGATPLQANNDAAKRENQPATNSSNVAGRKSQNPAPILTCSGVAPSQGGGSGRTTGQRRCRSWYPPGLLDPEWPALTLREVLRDGALAGWQRVALCAVLATIRPATDQCVNAIKVYVYEKENGPHAQATKRGAALSLVPDLLRLRRGGCRHRARPLVVGALGG